MKHKYDADKIFRNYLDGTADPTERAIVETWFDQHSLNERQELSENEISAELALIRDNLEKLTQPKRVLPLWGRIGIAASFFFALGAGLYVVKHTDQAKAPIALQQDIKPGGNKATLTLANGQKIILTGARNGKLANQADAQITKTADGKLSYQSSRKDDTAPIYNTMSTPVGGKYELTLSDGTKVTLDAASSITYPVTFKGKERRITITGQAYLEVVHDAAHPFYVSTNGQTIEDIGTEFNINAYDNENTQTTLVSGSVKVNHTLLKPGEQAAGKDHNLSVKNADIEAVTAWKHNDFLFRNQDLRSTMQQLARWYNLTVVYDHAPEDLRIKAQLSRTRNLSVILKAIEATGKIKFKLNGQTLTVSQ